MIGATRFKGGDLYELHHFFDRWRMLPKFSLLVAILFLVSSSALLFRSFRRDVPVGVFVAFYAAGIYMVAISFPIIGINPVRLALDLHSRYLAPFFPIALVFVVWTVWRLASRVMQSEKSLRVFISICVVFLGVTFIYGSKSFSCESEVGDGSSAHLSGAENFYCRIFRYSQEQVIYPSPVAFAFVADSYYQSFASDYIEGRVALFGFTRIGAFEWFVRASYPDAQFIETQRGWYSIDGTDKALCVKELGSFTQARENYKKCDGLTMAPGIID
jgi:hypothetical protein